MVYLFARFVHSSFFFSSLDLLYIYFLNFCVVFRIRTCAHIIVAMASANSGHRASLTILFFQLLQLWASLNSNLTTATSALQKGLKWPEERAETVPQSSSLHKKFVQRGLLDIGFFMEHLFGMRIYSTRFLRVELP